MYSLVLVLHVHDNPRWVVQHAHLEGALLVDSDKVLGNALEGAPVDHINDRPGGQAKGGLAGVLGVCGLIKGGAVDEYLQGGAARNLDGVAGCLLGRLRVVGDTVFGGAAGAVFTFKLKDDALKTLVRPHSDIGGAQGGHGATGEGVFRVGGVVAWDFHIVIGCSRSGVDGGLRDR